ncbi:MAG: 3-dehydroquinate synthase [Chloroflexota bacterium]
MAKKIRSIDITGSSLIIGQDALAELKVQLEFERIRVQSFFILVDDNTSNHCLPILVSKIPLLEEACTIVIKPGEDHKTIQTCEFIWSELARHGANRNSMLINLGGGVITDIGGFAASAYHRGMSFINVPTTLMSMIDASIGGKTGVDLSSLKNIVGLFSNPRGIFVWPDFLKTLPHHYLVSGYAEMLKHAMISEPRFWKILTKMPMSLIRNWDEFIYEAASIKCRIVNNDPYESGYRRLLNFGHTLGHAFETYSLRHDENPISHGWAVAMGMICETYISYRLLDLSLKQRDEIVKTILANFDHYEIDANSIDELVELTYYDKKNRNGVVLLSLLREIGKAVDGQPCDAAMIRESLFRYTDFRRYR